jgi:protein-tyrosine phosphatase
MLAFHDLGENAPPEYQNGLFTDEQAAQIVAFVKASDPTTTILVNCEAGVSRSAAVAAALAKFFNGDDSLMFKKACPNMFVFRKMLNALGIDSTSKRIKPDKDFFRDFPINFT